MKNNIGNYFAEKVILRIFGAQGIISMRYDNPKKIF